MTPIPDFNNFNYRDSSSSDYEYNKELRMAIKRILDKIRDKRGSINEDEVEEKEFLSKEDMDIQ